MLTEADFEMFKTFRCRAMGEKLREIVEDPAYDSMTFEEKMKELIDAESAARYERKVARLNKNAALKLGTACVEDIVYMPERNLDRGRIERLAECRWVEQKEVLVIISQSGCGKSYLCQALANAACRKLHSVRYTRLADMCADLARARAEGGCAAFDAIEAYKTVDLLILDDFLTTPIDTRQSVDLFEIIEARDRRGATLIASQLEPQDWFKRIQGDMMADSILGRTASTGRFLDLEGPNMREYFSRKRDEEERGK